MVNWTKKQTLKLLTLCIILLITSIAIFVTSAGIAIANGYDAPCGVAMGISGAVTVILSMLLYCFIVIVEEVKNDT